jgi:vancomycin resistance protein VanJ
MRKLLKHFVFIINVLVALLTVCGYLLPFLKPSQFKILSVLSLFLPVLIAVNLIFVLYWIIRFKRKVLLSAIVLLLGFPYLSSLYSFDNDVVESDLSVMSFNVRLFNLYDWISEDNIPERIADSIMRASPDVVCIQEFYSGANFVMPDYEYRYLHIKNQGSKVGQAIYSKYPIIDKGSVGFENTANNAVFADVVIDSDTIRMYNLHLQSLKITADVAAISQEEAQFLVKSMGKTFVKQENQMEQFLAHLATSPYPVVIAADLNNTAYSYVYSRLTEKVLDGFKRGGEGFGPTFNFRSFPVRIDFIFTDIRFSTSSQRVLQWKLSDHHPVISEIQLR